MAKYNVEVGQIYISADGSKGGHLVTDVTTFADCDDAVTIPFTASGVGEDGYRIDFFKLAMARCYIPEVIPDWVPETIRNRGR